MNNDPDMPISPGPAAPVSGGDHPPDRPHGLDPRALLEAVAEPTGDPVVVPPLPVPQPHELVECFPQLEIGECLGRGGMGVVYRARQRSLDRVVALKLLAPERGHDPAFAERFAREAQALARLNHPNIVTIHDFGQAGGFYYLLMEFVDGVNLRQAMQAGRFTPEQALAIVPPVCEALHYAHTHGIVHRDIKPENLLLDKDGRIKIADFGIAKMLHAEESDVGLAESQPAGTPRYMAPEQRDSARRTDHRTDIYSLGVVLYELLTGELPGARLEPPSRRVQIDVRLDEIVLRALEAEPDRRYQTAVEMRTRIEELGTRVDDGARTSDASFPAGATSGPSSPAAAAPMLRRAGRCTVITPERLATAAGQFFYFRDNRRQLLLDDSRLTLAEGPSTTVIPLTAIRDLSIGRYPRLVNPAGLDFICLTYDDGGNEARLLVTPYEGVFAVPFDRNRLVYDWWATIHAAVVAATGHAPTVTPANQLGTPRSSGWLFALMMVPMVIGFGLASALLVSPAWTDSATHRPVNGPGLLGLVLLTLAAFAPLLGASRNNQDEAATATTARPRWLGPVVGFLMGAAALLVGLGILGVQEMLILMALGGFAFWRLKKPNVDHSGSAGSGASGARGMATGACFALALGFTILFAAPHYSVLGSSGIMTWAVGLPTPWMTDILQVFSGGGQQRLRDMNLERPSFFCGFGALAAWMFWLRLRSRREDAALFEVVAPPTATGDRPRVRWGTLAAGWLAMSSLSVIAALLACVFMNIGLGGFPSPMPLLIFALLPVTVVFLNALRQGLQPQKPAASLTDRIASPPARSHGCLSLFLICLAATFALPAVLVFIWIANRSPTRSPAMPVPAQPAPVITSERQPPQIGPAPPSPKSQVGPPTPASPSAEQLFDR